MEWVRAKRGPEFTVSEYNALEELEGLEKKLYEEGRVAILSGMMGTLEKLIVVSGRWKKWINEDESADDFYAISPERRRWLLGTGARYVWQNPEAVL